MNTTQKSLFLFVTLETVPSDSTPENFAKIWQIKWNWLRSIKKCEFTFEVTFSVCCHSEILLPWQRDVLTYWQPSTTKPTYHVSLQAGWQTLVSFPGPSILTVPLQSLPFLRYSLLKDTCMYQYSHVIVSWRVFQVQVMAANLTQMAFPWSLGGNCSLRYDNGN